MSLRRLLVLSGCAALAACGGNDYDGQILGTLERDRLELIAESNEPIVEIAVREGDAVPAGAVLLRQELGAMQARLDQASAARAVAERRLAELIKGPRAQEITEARAAVESARSTLETETREYERVTDLVSRKLVSQSALDQARARRDSAAGTQKQAAARLHLLLEGTRSEEVEQAEATLKQAEAALVELQTSASRYVVKAPRAGRVEAIPYKLGERPAQGTPLIVMLADGVPYARVYVPEPLRTQFLPGTRTRIRVDGHDADLTGVVRFVSAEAAFTPYYALTQEDRSRLSYLAQIDLDERAAADVPTGMPVQVELAAKGD
ncbi:MAG TPA: HlyD family efflux transporter periplasmic adaptor subunit [Steroidobacteraceae bacterium]|nr:HlyD family efflux transporter periplasmic adaptor subunit [Steroidobacteraceae bacterium]